VPCLREIQGNKRQLRDVTTDALNALLEHNAPPTVFQRGGLLTRFRVREDDGSPYLEPLADAALRGILSRVANWMNARDTRDGQVLEDDVPPQEAVADLANLPGWHGVPVVKAVVECPVFARDGGLILTPGYHASARLWYHPAPGLAVPAQPEKPTADDIARAKRWLLDELLGDFPFVGDASKAHALAALLLPFVREMIDGLTPFHLQDAPTEGTGKTLLANVIAIPATGRVLEAQPEATAEEEWRKRITAVLSESPVFILLDNLNHTLDSGALASVLTCRVWRDRVLGFTKTATLPNTAVWLGSGNNARLSRELIRRTVLTRLDAGLDAPWERTEFRHPNLIRWALDHRGELVWSALTLCRAWLAAGRPAGKQTLGMFESWAEVIGGILDVAGVPGLLGNAREFRASHADKVSEWRAFVVSWWQEFCDRTVGVEDLFGLADRQKLLDSVMGDKGERSQRTRLGLAMAKTADRVYGGYRVERAGEDYKGRQQYRLREVQAAGATPSTPTLPTPPPETGEWTA
jgi:hypothetical protein